MRRTARWTAVMAVATIVAALVAAIALLAAVSRDNQGERDRTPAVRHHAEKGALSARCSPCDHEV
jgi:hypothetical protein